MTLVVLHWLSYTYRLQHSVQMLSFAHATDNGSSANIISQMQNLILPGVEPGIFGSVDRRLIHLAIGPHQSLVVGYRVARAAADWDYKRHCLKIWPFSAISCRNEPKTSHKCFKQ